MSSTGPARRAHRRIDGVLLALVVAGCGSTAFGAEAAAPSDVERFCTNVGDPARDARFAWEARTLEELKGEIEAKTAALEAKRAELEEWVNKRESLLNQAEQALVDIYSKMRPDAAALQLATLDPDDAAAILAKLKPRSASAVLAEMDTRRAASLASLIAGGKDEAPTALASQ